MKFKKGDVVKLNSTAPRTNHGGRLRNITMIVASYQKHSPSVVNLMTTSKSGTKYYTHFHEDFLDKVDHPHEPIHGLY